MESQQAVEKQELGQVVTLSMETLRKCSEISLGETIPSKVIQ